MNRIKLVLICLFSFLLGLGRIGEGFSFLDYISALSLSIFLAIHFLQNPKIIGNYFKLDFLLLFLVFLVMSLAQAIYGETAYSKMVFNFQYLSLILIYIVLKDVFLSSEKYLNYSLFFFCVGVVFLVLYGLLVGGLSHKGQLIVFGQNPNSTSSRVVISLVVMLYTLLFIKEVKGFKKTILFILSIVLFIFLVKTGSRGSLLSLLLSMILALFFLNTSLKRRLQYFISFIGFLFLFYFYINSDLLLVQRWGAVLEGNTAGRTDIWIDAYRVFLKSPLIGVGESGYFQEIFYSTGRYIDTHNLFIYITVAGGIISLLAFLSFIFMIIKDLKFNLIGMKLLSSLLMVNIIIIAFKTGGALTYFVMWFVLSICSAINNSKITKK